MQWQEFHSSIRHLPSKDISRIERAFTLGKKVHGDQKRKSGEPYFSHPVAVALMLADMGADADTLIAALLHDTVEDTDLSLEDIDRDFNGSVGTIIDGVTKLCADDVASSPKLDEQKETIRKIFTLMQEDVRIMIIKLVDRLHNMQTIEFLAPERQKTLAKETLDIYVKIADKLCMQDLRDELEALCLSILEPSTYKDLARHRAMNEERGQNIVKNIQTTLSKHDSKLADRSTLRFEYKTWEKLRAQMLAAGSVTTGLSAITIVFIAKDLDDCYGLLGALHQIWKRETMSFQDFINAPQINGYQGLHTTIILDDGTRVRCKIRTQSMHEYARKGIVMKSFDSKALGIAEYLPWAKRISALTIDTEGSSEDFWESLQSDILGETITIHGPDDSTMQMPRESTALDAAFFFLKKNATKIESILLNGAEVSFDTPLINSMSIEVVLSKRSTVSLEWLNFVHTRVAKAGIRSALSQFPRAEKIRIGTESIQILMDQKKAGQLEEFDTQQLSNALKKQGLPATKEALIEIAEGKRKADEIYEKLFRNKKNPNEYLERKNMYRVKCSIDENYPSIFQKLNVLSQFGEIQWNTLRIYKDKRTMSISFTVKATNEGITLFDRALRQGGAKNLERMPISRYGNFLIGIIILLWALNPVIAKKFLIEGITPITLFSVRMLTFCFCTTLFYLVWRWSIGNRFKRIPRLTQLALLPSAVTAALAIFTYEALIFLPPSIHLTIIRCNALLIPSLFFIRKRLSLVMSMAAFLLFSAGILLLTISPVPYFSLSIISSLLAVIMYSSYSVITEDTLHKHKIGLRYPALMFRMGVLLGLLGLFLVPIVPWDTVPHITIILLALYTICCVFVPHVLFTTLLNTKQIQHLNDLFFIEPPIAIVTEILILGIILPLWIYAVMLIGLLAIYALRNWKDLRTKMLHH